MNFTSIALPPPFAEALVRKTFEWGRIQSNADWILPVGALALILLFVRWMYVRDAADWHAVLGWLLTVLRTLALVQGTLVLRGQASSERSEPYELWRDALRQLVLTVDLDDAEAGVLGKLDILLIVFVVINYFKNLDVNCTEGACSCQCKDS